MQLKIQRSQRAGGVLGNTVFFCLDVRADFSSEEQSNIQKYKLGSQVIYNSQAARKHLEHAGAHLDQTQTGGAGKRASGLARGALSMAMAKMSLNISIASLGKGHHIECKDLEELLEAEETVRTACKNVTRYLEAAATFDGSEIVIDYDKGEERVHVTQNAPPLIEYQPPTSAVSEVSDAAITKAPPGEASREFGRAIARLWAATKKYWLVLETKLRAFAAAKGWDVKCQKMFGAMGRPVTKLKQRWLTTEKKLIALAAAKGCKMSERQFRAACGIIGVIAFIIFVLLV